MDDLELLRAYEPVVRYTEGELFFPVAVEDYVACCEVLERADRTPRPVLGRGEVTLDRLAEVGAGHPGPGLFLRLVEHPLSRTALAAWRLRADRPRFRNASRLAQVGVLSRVVDALLRLSLLLRGTVARGTQAAAEVLYRERMRHDHHPYYGRVVRGGGYVALQYWFFYAFNDWRSRAYGVNDHEADWEQVIVYLAEEADGGLRPAWVVFSSHDEVGDDLRRRWDDPDLTLVGGTHPVVHAGLGSHSGAYLAGEYLTTVDPPAFKRFIAFSRRVARVLLGWTRDYHDVGLGIPYVDYARGDGLVIGPAGQRSWSPVLIDESTPWVVDYRGLWGNDTADPLGGERGPAGPRFDRDGSVRPAWGNPVVWAGLAKVAPNAHAAAVLVQQRLAELDGEVEAAAEALDTHRTRLRAAAASGVIVHAAQEAELDDLAAGLVALRDERRRLAARLESPPPEPGPHDHLHHRRLPTTPSTRVRRRFLTLWAAFSTPLLLTAIALAISPTRTLPIGSVLLLWTLLLLGIEAAARRHLARFAATVVALVLVVSLLTTVFGLVVFFGWQAAVAVCLGALAVVLLVASLSELARD